MKVDSYGNVIPKIVWPAYQVEMILSWLAIICTFPFSGFWTIPWLTHLSMMDEEPIHQIKAPFSKFKKEAARQRWKTSETYDSLFGIGNEYEYNYLHASIFKVAGVGYRLSPYGFFKAKMWIKRKRMVIQQGRPYIPVVNL